jgi:hypothetical protein
LSSSHISALLLVRILPFPCPRPQNCTCRVREAQIIPINDIRQRYVGSSVEMAVSSTA